MDFLWVGVGAMIGANARYLVSSLLTQRLGPEFPFGTLVVNVSGSFLIGLLLPLLTARLGADGPWRLFLIVGVLGGYTTFSSFSIEVVALVQTGRALAAATYVAASVIVSLIACLAGVRVATLIGL